TEEAGDHTRPHRERQVIDGELVAVPFGQAPGLNHDKVPPVDRSTPVRLLDAVHHPHHSHPKQLSTRSPLSIEMTGTVPAHSISTVARLGSLHVTGSRPYPGSSGVFSTRSAWPVPGM